MFGPVSLDRAITSLLEALTSLTPRTPDVARGEFHLHLLARPAPPHVDVAAPPRGEPPTREPSDREPSPHQEPTGRDPLPSPQPRAASNAEAAPPEESSADEGAPADVEQDVAVAEQVPAPLSASPQTRVDDNPADDVSESSSDESGLPLGPDVPESRPSIPKPQAPGLVADDAGQAGDAPPMAEEAGAATPPADDYAPQNDDASLAPQEVEPPPPDQLSNRLSAVVQQLESLRDSLDGVLPPSLAERLDALLEQASQLARSVAQRWETAHAVIQSARELLAEIAQRLPPGLPGAEANVRLPWERPQLRPEPGVHGLSTVVRPWPHLGIVPVSDMGRPWDLLRGDLVRLPANALPPLAEPVQPLPLPVGGALLTEVAGLSVAAASLPVALPDAPLMEPHGAVPPQSDRVSPQPVSSDAGTAPGQRGPAPLKLQRPGPATQFPAGFHTDRFVHRVAHAVQAALERGGPIRLRLSPPELGSLRLVVSLREGALSARLEAETAATRSLLLDHLSLLRDRLAQQQIKIERFEVDLLHQPAADQRHSGGDARRQQHGWHVPPPAAAPESPRPLEPAAAQGQRPRSAVHPEGVDVVV